MQTVTIAIKAKSEGVQKELNNTKKKFSDLNKNMVSDESTKNLSKMKNALGGIGKMGDSLGGTLGKIAGGFTSMLNPIGLVTAGITAIITVSVQLYKKLTMSNEEYIAYLSNSFEIAKKKFSDFNEALKKDEGYLDRLKTLQQEETLDNAIKSQAIELISILEAKYGKLGIVIDEATGKIKYFDDALQAINIQNQAEIVKYMEKQYRIARLIRNARETESGRGMRRYSFSKQQIAELDAIKVERDSYKNKTSAGDRAEYQRLDKKYKLLDQIQHLEQDLAQAQENLWKNASDPKAFEKAKATYTAIETELKTARDLLTQLESMGNGKYARLRQTAILSALQKSSKGRIAGYEKQTKANEEGIKNEQQNYRLSLLSKGNKYNQYGIKADELTKKRDTNRAQQTQIQTEIDKLKQQQKLLQEKEKAGKLTLAESKRLLQVNKALIEAEQKLSKLKLDESTINKDLASVQLKRKAILDELNNNHKKTIQALDREIALQKLIIEGKIKEAERQRIINQLKEQGYDKIQGVNIEAMADQIIAKRTDLNKAKFIGDETNALNEALQLQKLRLKGDYQAIELYKLRLQLRKRGIELDEKELASLRAKKKELRGLQLKNDLKTRAEGLYNETDPNQKEAEKRKRIKEYEDKYGKLTDDQKKNIGQLVDLEFKLKELQNNRPNFGMFDTKTNQLTARGGLSGGALVVDKDKVNKEIKVQAEKQVSLLGQIKTLIEKIDKI